MAFGLFAWLGLAWLGYLGCNKRKSLGKGAPGEIGSLGVYIQAGRMGIRIWDFLLVGVYSCICRLISTYIAGRRKRRNGTDGLVGEATTIYEGMWLCCLLVS